MRSDDGTKAAPARTPALAQPKPPLVLSVRQGQREVISIACPAAIGLGLTPGMPITQARAYVAGLTVLPSDPEGDERLLARLTAHALRHWSPVAAVCPPDGLWVDLAGMMRIYGSEERFCAQVVGFFKRLGFTVRIAVADSSGAAHGLARFGSSSVTVVPPGGTVDAIAHLPVEALRLSADAIDTARRFGMDRVVDLLAMPRAPLARRLGRDAIARLDQAIGREVEQIVPAVLTETPSVFRQMLEPIGTPEAIAHVIGTLVSDMSAVLLACGLGARALRMVFHRVDSNEQTLLLGTARATRDAAHLTRLFRLKMETVDPGLGIETARLTAERVEPLDAHQMRADLAGNAPDLDLAPLVDQLVGRVGEGGVFRTAPVESDVPERAVRRTGPLETPTGWPSWRRPARLLQRPEPLTSVIALLPDHPPRRFAWRGNHHTVVAGDGPERIFGEWWVRDGEVWAVRDYFHVQDGEGRRYWLFRRGDGVQNATGDLSWWLHGVG